MNHPNRPQQPSVVPGVPPPPPKINVRRLWLTLLTPSIVMVFIMVALFFAADSMRGGEVFMTIACSILCIAFGVAWGFYIHTLYQRFRGPSLALLILAYPVLQATLIFGIFFAGCLAFVALEGY